MRFLRARTSRQTKHQGHRLTISFQRTSIIKEITHTLLPRKHQRKFPTPCHVMSSSTKPCWMVRRMTGYQDIVACPFSRISMGMVSSICSIPTWRKARPITIPIPGGSNKHSMFCSTMAAALSWLTTVSIAIMPESTRIVVIVRLRSNTFITLHPCPASFPSLSFPSSSACSSERTGTQSIVPSATSGPGASASSPPPRQLSATSSATTNPGHHPKSTKPRMAGG